MSECVFVDTIGISKLLKNTFDKNIPTGPPNCLRRISKYIYNNLTKTYNYGKIWTVHTSFDSFTGRKDGNVAEGKIGPVKVLVYFSNPIINDIAMPFEEIEENLVSRSSNFFEMFRFWDHLCPYPWADRKELIRKFYHKLESYDYCGSRSLCVVGTGRHIGYFTDNNVDMGLFAPCVGRSSIPVLMGPEEDQEMKYPLDNTFNEEYPSKLLNILKGNITQLKSKYRREIERAEREIERELELEELDEEMAEFYVEEF